MRKLLLSGVALLACLGASNAQVNSVPQVGVLTSNTRQPTYSAAAVGLVPAASATDLFCISGSATRTVAVRRIEISGTAGTLVTTPVVVLRRATLNTGGTAATGVALPAATSNITGGATATAALTAYTANPTINDANPGFLRAAVETFPTSAAGVVISTLAWQFGTGVDMYDQGADIQKGQTNQQICVNLQGTTITGGLLYINIEWVEPN